MKIPERNLNPPPDDHEICDNCNGAGKISLYDVNSGEWFLEICSRCHGDGVVSKAELKRELGAVIGDIEHDRREDDKWRREEEGK